MKKLIFRDIGIILLYWVLFRIGITPLFLGWIYDHVNSWQVTVVVLIIGASCLFYSVFQEKNA